MKKTGFKKKEYKWGIISQIGINKKNINIKRRTPLKKFKEIEGKDSKGNEILQVNEADRIFSIQIRERDGRCLRCGSTAFQTCSHFFKRAIYSTRFDPDNCDDFCQPCHEEWEGDPNGEYLKFKIEQLGTERFTALIVRARIRISPKEAVIKFMDSVGPKIKDIQY